jgi:hypothetical protein
MDPLFEDHRVVVVGIGNPIFEAEYVEIKDVIEMPMLDVEFKSPAPELFSYWTLEEERGAKAQLAGSPVSSTIEVSYALVHNANLVCAGPETLRRFPSLPQSFLRFITIVDDKTNCAVAARRRNDERPSVLGSVRLRRELRVTLVHALAARDDFVYAKLSATSKDRTCLFRVV